MKKHSVLLPFVSFPEALKIMTKITIDNSWQNHKIAVGRSFICVTYGRKFIKIFEELSIIKETLVCYDGV